MPAETLSVRYVRTLIDAVEARGVSRACFLETAGWEVQRADAVEGRVPACELSRLWELALDLTGDPALGLHVIETVRPDSVDLAGQLVAHASTVRSALDSHLRLNKLTADIPRVQLIESEHKVTLRYHCPDGLSPRARRFAAELHMVGMYRLFRYFARQARPLEVCFEHDAPDYRAEYERIFKGAQRFAQPVTGIGFERALMEAARRYRDDEYHRTLCELAVSRVSRLRNGASCADEVREVIARHGRGKVGMGPVARVLGVSTRSLRRRLSAEGTSFDAVANDALAKRARHLLSIAGMTIQEAAYTLGYSDPTSFHRAFKRWTGTTPSAWQAGLPGQATRLR